MSSRARRMVEAVRNEDRVIHEQNACDDNEQIFHPATPVLNASTGITNSQIITPVENQDHHVVIETLYFNPESIFPNDRHLIKSLENDKNLVQKDVVQNDIENSEANLDTFLPADLGGNKDRDANKLIIASNKIPTLNTFSSDSRCVHPDKNINGSFFDEDITSTSSEYEYNSSDESSSSNSSHDKLPKKRISLTLQKPLAKKPRSNFVHQTAETELEPTNQTSASEAEEETRSMKRKRTKDPQRWKRQIMKKKVQTGEEHRTKSGRIIKKKVMKEACKCRKHCSESLNDEKRKQIFDKFWSMSDYSRQSAFVGNCVRRVPKKRVKPQEGEQPRKKSSLIYSFLIKSEESNLSTYMEVCKTMFLNTLNITDMWVMTALKKKDVSVTGTVTPDKRGTHSSRPFVISEVVKKSIRDHINLFPRVPSHYCRENTSKEYLEDDLSIAKMYRLYREWCSEKKLNLVASERQYRDLMNDEFNIGFFQPKKDRCETCVDFELKVLKTPDIINSYQKHLDRKKRSRELKDGDKLRAADKNEKFSVCCFDLQKVIQIPQSNTSVFYYKLKLSTLNLSIFDMATKEGFCFIWHEQIGKRGANEISSCVYRFLMEKVNGGYKEVTLYSDNCIGQNKNRMIVSMYYYVSKKYNISICHRFLEPGHTQNENDSIHALIERKKREMDLFTPDQFIQLVKMAKISGKPYKVHEMNQTNFYDFKKLSENFKNFLKDSENKKICWNNIKEIKIEKENPENVLLKYDYDNEPVILQLKNKTTRLSGSTRDLPELKQCYSSKIPLTKKKYEHLQFLKNKVPETYRYFYESLTFSEDVRDNDSD